MNSTRLRYSFGNEDWRTEREALRIRPKDRIACITASGDRVLNLLLEECAEIAAIDVNPAQNHLLSLKMSAMQHFDFDTYLEFLGAKKAKGRKTQLSELKCSLPGPSAQYWENNIKMIEAGVLYEGLIEKVYKFANPWTIFRRKKIEKLFQFDDIEEQKKFINEEWDSKWLRKVFDLFLHPSFSKIWMKDPGLYENLDPEMKPGKYLYERFNNGLQRRLAKENYIYSFVCLGEVKPESYPPYLTKEGTNIIKNRLDRVKIHTGNVINFLENQPANSFDCYSVSDVLSYINPEEINPLFNAIYHSAKPGARFCFRQFLSSHQIPNQFIDKFQRENELEKYLEHHDHEFVYRFMVGTIEK